MPARPCTWHPTRFAIKVAAHILEAAEEDMDIEDGRVSSRDRTSPIDRTCGEGMPGSLPGGVVAWRRHIIFTLAIILLQRDCRVEVGMIPIPATWIS